MKYLVFCLASAVLATAGVFVALWFLDDVPASEPDFMSAGSDP